jgi:hypothetical protein
VNSPEGRLVATDTVCRLSDDVMVRIVCKVWKIPREFLGHFDEVTMRIAHHVLEALETPNDVPGRIRRRVGEFTNGNLTRPQKIIGLLGKHMFSLDGRIELLGQTQKFLFFSQRKIAQRAHVFHAEFKITSP